MSEIVKTILGRLMFLAILVGLGWVLDTERGALLGLGMGLACLVTAWWIRGVGTKVLLGGIAGILVGIGSAYILLAAVGGLHLGEGLDLPGIRDPDLLTVKVLLVGSLAYLGGLVGVRRAATFSLKGLPFVRETGEARKVAKILDTSVIIDGRIGDVVAAGFIEGIIVAPQFVLRELQQIADSADAARRNRGRRGLDILKALTQDAAVEVQISEIDYPEIREVDLKLIELARELNGKIITNDFNLNKVAQLRGVAVLNVNDLANALKPAVLAGEIMRVFVLKEGKELSQGVAYLDDGTMVVVDNARRAIGKTIDIAVTSVHQTSAGKMIFGRFDGGIAMDGNQTGSGPGTVPFERRERRPRAERGPIGPTPGGIAGQADEG